MVHRVAQSAAGYLYQARLALVEALRYAYVDSSIEIAVEKLDDVSFEKDGSALLHCCAPPMNVVDRRGWGDAGRRLRA